MGRKRSRQGKQLYFYIASLIFLSLWGCALIKEVKERGEARESLLRGQKLLAQGDYEGAMKENQRVWSLFNDRPPGDEALFNLGLIYAHVENPKRDYRKAAGLFRTLLKEYPQSPWVEQAKIWVGVLQANEKLAQANEKLNQLMEKSKQVDLEIEEKRRERQR